ncbi:DUF4157 domain-containing protein [Pseudonocardia alaniniphila]|uniref:DUF4157 domain-containing protein n=1 Tax=Pseudonocardia alaniniphila TaxID=75291 RepID=A0ABS9TA23_9PSEU|nr:DUF4157 domain-containing protein [Pseudonocardia alaniniphila]MCH6165141.1 DUF4157 domain-containing protein [Pseudonocardia alaniniphila]
MRDNREGNERGGDERASRHQLAPQGGRMSPEMVALQRSVGNRAVVEMLRRAGHHWAQEEHGHGADRDAAVRDIQRSGRCPLDVSTRTDVKGRFGAEFAGVRVHDDSAAAASTGELRALSHASGNHVGVGGDTGDVSTRFIQQREDRVAGTVYGSSDRFELETGVTTRTLVSRPSVMSGLAPSLSIDVQRASGDSHLLDTISYSSAVKRKADDDHAEAADYRRALKNMLANWATEGIEADQYNMMVATGANWEGWPEGDQEGRSFVAEQSLSNVTAMARELGPDDGWREPVRRKIETALKRRVLHHYTTRDRVEVMLGQGDTGELMSKRKLDQTAPGAENNTLADEDDLANHGFVFFFMEKAGAPFRNTRFGNGGSGSARIAVPLDRLVESGWIMLNDLLFPEYPAVRADPQGNLLSYGSGQSEDRMNSPEKKMDAARTGLSLFWGERGDDDDRVEELVYNLSEALAADSHSISPDTITDITSLAALSVDTNRNAEYRGLVDGIRREFARSVRFGSQVRRSYSRGIFRGPSKMYYMSGGAPGTSRREAEDRGEIKEYQEYLDGNILAGPHIVPGLAARGILEIARIEAQGGHEALVNGLTAMSGDDLVDTLLRDFIRPQAMLPWSVCIARGDVQYPTGRSRRA